MNPPKYVQIDASIYADNRVALLMRKHGAIGMAVYVYCLVEIGRQSNYPDMQISVDDIFIEAGAITNGIEYESFKAVTDDLFRIGLLQKTEGGAYSNGFNKRTGKDLLANYKRSISQAGVPKPKTDLKEPNLEPKNAENDHKCVKTDPKVANLGESEPKKEHKKAKGEPKDDPETDASKAVKAHIAALEDDFGAKNISNMSNVECAKIQAKYGAMTAYALRTYFLWKVSKGKRGGKDYLSLLAKWVQEEVEKESAKPHVETVVLPSKTPEEIALGEERRKMILERAGFGK